MDPLIDTLRRQTDGLDTTGMSPDDGLPTVVRRGRRYAAATTVALLVGASGAFAAVAVVAPAVLERSGLQAPTVLDAPTGEQDPPPPSEGVPDGPDDLEPVEPVALEPVVDEDQATDTTAPALTVLSPADGASVDAKDVTFTGTVEPGSTVEVGQYSATVAADGAWSIVLVASKGTNDVTFTATDAAGNVTRLGHTVVYVPADTTDGDPKDDGSDVVAAELTATQQRAELTGSPFVNVYSGTAPPGQKVAVLSDHGTGYVHADAAGDWRVEMAFQPPSGTTTFPVTVKLWERPEVSRSFTLTTRNDTAPQPFTATQARSQLTSAPYTNTYRGTATPGAKVKVLSDHGWEYGHADGAGSWEVVVTFTPPPGTTTFPVTARLYDDATVSETFTLTTVTPEADPFTASQQHDQVSVSSPVNVYSGAGEPGHEVLVWTESHGQTTTVVGQDGTWSVTLRYDDVATGDAFDVKARDMTGGTSLYFRVRVTDG